MGLIGSLLTTYIVVYLAFVARGYVTIHSPVFMCIHEMCILALFFCLLAECAHGGPRWLILQLVTHVIWAIALGQISPLFNAGNDVVSSTEKDPRAGLQTMWYLYFILSAFYRSVESHAEVHSVVSIVARCRYGALRDCRLARAGSQKEQWWFRILTVSTSWYAWPVEHLFCKCR
jgi:hypothetical protein